MLDPQTIQQFNLSTNNSLWNVDLQNKCLLQLQFMHSAETFATKIGKIGSCIHKLDFEKIQIDQKTMALSFKAAYIPYLDSNIVQSYGLTSSVKNLQVRL